LRRERTPEVQRELQIRNERIQEFRDQELEIRRKRMQALRAR
jgi:hypothetical protein